MDYENNKIPHYIFQTWHSYKLPVGMFNSVNNLIINNREFKYFLFDDERCRKFIKNNYSASIYDAYTRLIPGAYKADLWRYCVLYKHGGIYLDMRYTTHKQYKLSNLMKHEHFVKDIDGNNIYNACMVCKAGNPLLKKCIDEIVINVKNKNYGTSFLSPTGPELLGRLAKKMTNIIVDMKHENKNNQKTIKYKEATILIGYDNYHHERDKHSKKPHYALLWNARKVYI